MTEGKGKLSPEDWLKAGFRALAKDGPSGLRAEKIARDLSVSKGSFYWHFKSLTDFKSQMLAHWHTRAFVDVTRDVDRRGAATDRLIALARAAGETPEAYGGAAAEPAIREWSRSDSMVRAAVLDVDTKRLAYVEKLFADLGQRDPQAAALFYAAYIGYSQFSAADDMPGYRPETQADALIHLALALTNSGLSRDPV